MTEGMSHRWPPPTPNLSSHLQCCYTAGGSRRQRRCAVMETVVWGRMQVKNIVPFAETEGKLKRLALFPVHKCKSGPEAQKDSGL